MSLSGGKLAGGNPKNGRIENDYYATDPKAVTMLLDQYSMDADTFLEPCVGNGNIANSIKKYYKNRCYITAIDIVDRGYPNTIVQDYLNWDTDQRFESIITNPPFALAQQFVEKSMQLLADNGKMAFFLKIQFLEGLKRKEFYEKYPPKYIYVFRSRIATWNNGSEVDPNTGKRWASTMCYAWYVWEKGSKTEPIVRWL